LQTQSVDAVWWIPTYQHAFGKELAPYDDRRRMCELALEDLDRVRISDVERDLGGESRTIDTLDTLEERHPDTQFHLIVGSDILEETDAWKRWDEIERRTELVVVGRSGHDGAERSSKAFDFELPDVSSTRTREAFQENDRAWLNHWIPADVLDYALERNLYA
jgi:nicotinate-nucleotide adenylyltransferase